MAWLKLEHTAREHPKIKKLGRLLGVSTVEALGHMASLWCWTLSMSPEGDLSRFDDGDLADAAMWEGEPHKFVNAIVSVGLLDNDGKIHEWMDRAGSYKEAKRQHNFRESKKASRDSHVTVTLRSQDSHVTEERRGEERRRDEKRGEETTTPCAPEVAPLDVAPAQHALVLAAPEVIDAAIRGVQADQIRAVFDHYRTYHPRAHRNPLSTSKEWRLIADRIKEGSTVEDLCQAIDGCHASRFHQGDNDRGKPFNSLELIVRDGSKVAQFIQLWETREGPTPEQIKARKKILESQAYSQELQAAGERRDAERAARVVQEPPPPPPVPELSAEDKARIEAEKMAKIKAMQEAARARIAAREKQAEGDCS